MKTKTLFLLCLFLGIGLNQLSAQNGRNGTGTITYNQTVECYILLENNGVFIGEIAGDIEYHWREHYVNGEITWLKASCEGELTNKFTGEVFRISELNKSIEPFDFETFDGYFWVHDNIMGDKGSHYILQCLWNFYTFDVINLKLIIPGN
jgi:hypothetical protein